MKNIFISQRGGNIYIGFRRWNQFSTFLDLNPILAIFCCLCWLLLPLGCRWIYCSPVERVGRTPCRDLINSGTNQFSGWAKYWARDSDHQKSHHQVKSHDGTLWHKVSSGTEYGHKNVIAWLTIRSACLVCELTYSKFFILFSVFCISYLHASACGSSGQSAC